MAVKNKTLKWQAKSGLRKAEFLRNAFMVGVLLYANQLNAKDINKGFFEE